MGEACRGAGDSKIQLVLCFFFSTVLLMVLQRYFRISKKRNTFLTPCRLHLQDSKGMDRKHTLTRQRWNNTGAITEGVILVEHDKYITSSRSAIFLFYISLLFLFFLKKQNGLLL